jgi:hypothetical protein
MSRSPTVVPVGRVGFPFTRGARGAGPQRGSCAWLADDPGRGSSPRAVIHSALVSSQNQLSSESDLPPPAPGVSRRGRLLPNEAPFPFLAPDLGFGGARRRARGHSATDPSIHTQRRSGPCCLVEIKGIDYLKTSLHQGCSHVSGIVPGCRPAPRQPPLDAVSRESTLPAMRRESSDPQIKQDARPLI